MLANACITSNSPSHIHLMKAFLAWHCGNSPKWQFHIGNGWTEGNQLAGRRLIDICSNQLFYIVSNSYLEPLLPLKHVQSNHATHTYTLWFSLTAAVPGTKMEIWSCQVWRHCQWLPAPNDCHHPWELASRRPTLVVFRWLTTSGNSKDRIADPIDWLARRSPTSATAFRAFRALLHLDFSLIFNIRSKVNFLFGGMYIEGPW